MNRSNHLTVGTRTSPLSLTQTREVLALLEAANPNINFTVSPITTKGDRENNKPLVNLGRGSFVKEIELALINKKIDFAVHSAKDLTTPVPDGLILAAAPQRKDPRDVLINKWKFTLPELPPLARIGTSSPRRTAQLLALRPDLRVLDIRGNVGTRINKTRGNDYDGVILAAAGLIRLRQEEWINEYFIPKTFTPEVGQGTLAIETRSGDKQVLNIVSKIDHKPSSIALAAERAFLSVFGGGCEIPITAYAQVSNRNLHILAMAAKVDGSKIFRTQVQTDASDPKSSGRQAGEALLKAGASEII